MQELPLILLPGLLNTEQLWADQVVGLGSERPVRVYRTDSFDSLFKLASSILEDAPERFALAGLSMGGYVAFEIMRQAPERVDRLALVDTTARPDSLEQSTRRTSAIAEALENGLDEIINNLLPSLLDPKNIENRNLITIIKQMAHKIGVEGFINQQRAILSRPDSRSDLANIHCPTIILVGLNDRLTPLNFASEMQSRIPVSSLVEIPESGHLSPLENPSAVTVALRGWLKP